jgi:ParB family chromosome partitioning protein
VSRRGGLGRGLAALIPPAPSDEETDVAPLDDPEQQVPTTTATLAQVDPEDISANPRQPREVFDPDELDGLATSLRDVGMLQPLVVRPVGERYELVAGERRWRAAKLAGLDTVPAVVRHTDDADLLKEALVENIHRVQLNPLEEAAAYQQLLDDFGVTQEELANRLGKSRPVISNALRLLTLPPAVQRRVAAGVLTAGHAKALLAIDDPEQLTKVADRIVAEGLSVRGTEELVRLRLLDAEQAPLLARPFYADGDPGPIVAALAQVPELLEVAIPFISTALGPSAISWRDKEIVIVRTSALLECSYCVATHTVVALDAGLTRDEVLALRGEAEPAEVFEDPRERALLGWVDALAGERGPVPDDVSRRLSARWEDHEVVELEPAHGRHGPASGRDADECRVARSAAATVGREQNQ